jgi:hypothetical protein
MNESVPCVKCGTASCWTGPTYHAGETLYVGPYQPPLVFAESLVWVCRGCGWKRTTPTCDVTKAKPEPPPNQRIRLGGIVRRHGWLRRWLTAEWLARELQRIGHEREIGLDYLHDDNDCGWQLLHELRERF